MTELEWAHLAGFWEADGSLSVRMTGTTDHPRLVFRFSISQKSPQPLYTFWQRTHLGFVSTSGKQAVWIVRNETEMRLCLFKIYPHLVSQTRIAQVGLTVLLLDEVLATPAEKRTPVIWKSWASTVLRISALKDTNAGGFNKHALAKAMMEARK